MPVEGNSAIKWTANISIIIHFYGTSWQLETLPHQLAS